jgi:hypothetical protein
VFLTHSRIQNLSERNNILLGPVQRAQKAKSKLVRWDDILRFGNGNDIKKHGEDAKGSWDTWRKKTEKTHLSAKLQPFDRYSVLPCPELHPAYVVSHSDPDKHDSDFWVMYGCDNPLHYHHLKEGSLGYECLPNMERRIKIAAELPEAQRPFNTDEAWKRLEASNAA